MMCDILLASPTAVFGQPEMNVRVVSLVPAERAAWGHSRHGWLAIHHARARQVEGDGDGLDRWQHDGQGGRALWPRVARRWWCAGRASGRSDARTEGEDEVVKEAIRVAEKIASKGALAVQAGKEAVLASAPRRR